MIVSLIGAGPGDPGLLTLKGLDRVRTADVIVYDRLIHPDILKYARPDAELIYVGKASGAHTMKQEDINQLLVEKAREGKRVVRLKGGDPFVFGRGGEEAETLMEAGIPFEVVPGITSAVGVPAYAGIPVTHRGLAVTLGIVTGHERSDGETQRLGEEAGRVNWQAVAGLDTIVFLMGVENLPNIVSRLIQFGRERQTPVALIRWGTRSEQETLVGTLDDIAEKAQSARFKAPAVTVVGDVVNLREKLRWFDNRPLFGKKILVTRSREQASELSELLRERGAEPIEFPLINISPPESFQSLDSALSEISEYDWLLFTSANGVGAVTARLQELGQDVRSLKGPKIGAIGPATADSLSDLGIRVDFIPSKFVAEAVADEFPEDLTGKRVLIAQAAKARRVIPDRLSEMGARVDIATAYRTEIEESDAAQVKELLEKIEIDVITFTSSSTVQNFVKLVGASVPEGVTIACIGPITAQTAEDLGLTPDLVAKEHSVQGLVDMLAAEFAS